MTEELVNIEIDGTPLKARKGSMVIQAADEASIYIPRFCYHKKLSIAANCRMCLVEVEKAPKPLPACATPVAEGMKVYTRSPKAIAAQKATMEFLLINHPLDCPICDQGGECELQDLAMGYGRDVSRFTEKKRVVKDKNLGPLISTDMTRCIHCTRCVRFGIEVAGIQELGATGRGEHMEIGTYVEKAVEHELSGNVIDLCPVGALNSKPFRMRGRGWEMTRLPTIAPHDCVGSNIDAHVLRGRLMRVVPRDNEAVNETWISDRDRFSYEGIYSADRLLKPLLKRGGQWQEVEWDVALEAAAEALRTVKAKRGADALGFLASPCATTEELYLLQKIARGLGCHNVDHRLRQADFRDDAEEPLWPGLGMPIADLERIDAALIVGSDLRAEAPLLAHRLRKAALRGGRVLFVNPRRYPVHFGVAGSIEADKAGMLEALAGIGAALEKRLGRKLPDALRPAVDSVKPDATHVQCAEVLMSGGRRVLLLGQIALAHPAYADLRALAAGIALLADATLGYVTFGANSAGAWFAGAVPHRTAGGKQVEQPGRPAREMFAKHCRGFVLFGFEPELDCWDGPEALEALGVADTTIVMTPFVTETMKRYASILLPVGTFAETAGTFINAEGRWQSFNGVVPPVGAARPGWKVLRVLGNLLGLADFEHLSIEDVRVELQRAIGEPGAKGPFAFRRRLDAIRREASSNRLWELPLYQSDPLVRRARALQETPAAQRAAQIVLSADLAAGRGISDGERVRVGRDGISLTLTARVDETLPANTALVPCGVPASATLGAPVESLEVARI